MPRPSREETLLRELLKLSPVTRKTLLKKATGAGKDLKKLKARRRELLKQIRGLEKDLAKIDKQLGGGSGRGGAGRKRGPRDPEATRQARITRYTNSIPKLEAEIARAKGPKKDRLEARLEKAQRLLRELKK